MALASAGARADGSTSGFLVAYGTLASFCCGDDVKRGSAATLDHQRSRVDRLVAANVAGLHLEAKLLHSGSVNLHFCSTACFSCKYKLVLLGPWCAWVVQCRQRWRCCSGARWRTV